MRSRRSPAQRGQSMIEFALVLPLLSVLLVGSLSLGRGAYDSMIVQELSDEAGKAAAIDRMGPGGSSSRHQMSSKELLEWIQAAAHTEDSSIDPAAIRCRPSMDFTSGSVPSGVPKDNGGGVFGTLVTGGQTIGQIAPLLNPNIMTMNIRYNYDTGFGGASIPIDYTFHYTAYEMVWFPNLGNGAGQSGACS
jgi:hypothetical protein